MTQMRALVTSARAALRAVACAVLATLLLSAPAQADGIAVIQDCVQGADGISGTYTQREYKEALEMLSGDGDEYSDCRDQIREAQYAAARGGGTSGATTGSSTGLPGGAANVSPDALGSALRDSGIDPGAAPGTVAAEPENLSVDGEQIDLSNARTPSVAAALSLPLPLAAAAIVALLSALLPAGRSIAARIARRRGDEPAAP